MIDPSNNYTILPIFSLKCYHILNPFISRYFHMVKLVKCNDRVLVSHVLIGYKTRDISCRWYVLVKSRILWQGNLQYKPTKYIQFHLFVATIIMILRIIFLLLLFSEWFETFGNNIFYSFPQNIKNSKETSAFISKRNELSTFLLDSKL